MSPALRTPPKPTIAGTSGWFDQRLGFSKVATKQFKKVFPDHWSFMLGEITMYSFVLLFITGAYLTFFFEPSVREVTYDGSYAPLQGTLMSAAYNSALDISFDVRAGLVMRQMHHWAALIFLAAMVVHLLRVFFTGAFRKPRELNWIIGVGLLVMSMFNGFLGYSLLDDLLSGTGVRVAYNILMSIPLIGPWAADLVFGGAFPSPQIIPRFFAIHVLLLPAAIIALMSVHLGLVWFQKHTQFPGPGRTERNVVGSRLFPGYGAKALGLFFLVAAVTALLGGLVQINAVWIFGPFESSDAAAQVSSASQPDWYMAWPDGILRLIPGWETRIGGFTVPNPFWGGIVAPGVVFTLMMLWPFIEAKITKDTASHNLLERPRDNPTRTGFGVALVVLFSLFTFAGSNDVIGTIFSISPESITYAFRVGIFVAPVAAFFITRRICNELRGTAEHPAYPGPSHVVTRTVDGGYDFGHGGHVDPPYEFGNHPDPTPVDGTNGNGNDGHIGGTMNSDSRKEDIESVDGDHGEQQPASQREAQKAADEADVLEKDKNKGRPE